MANLNIKQLFTNILTKLKGHDTDISNLNSNLSTIDNKFGGVPKILYKNLNYASVHSYPVTANKPFIGIIILDDSTLYTIVQWGSGSVSIYKISGSNTITLSVSDGFNKFSLTTARGLTIWTT